MWRFGLVGQVLAGCRRNQSKNLAHRASQAAAMTEEKFEERVAKADSPYDAY
jgi:hypothetical protein